MASESELGEDGNSKSLRRVLGLTTGILMVAGIMIGSGIFKKIAPMAALGLGAPEILLAWIMAGVITLFGAVSVSGLADLTVESGGEYEYLRLVYGRFSAFMFGWASFTIIGSASIAAMGFIFAQSVHALWPLYEAPAPLAEMSVAGFIRPFDQLGIKLFSVASIVMITWVNTRGTKSGARLYNAITCLKLAGILFLVATGLFFAGSLNQGLSTGASAPIRHSYSMLPLFFSAMLSAFWAYDGWLNVAFISGEIRNPSRNVPIAMVTGVLLVMALYLLINMAFLRVMPVNELAALPADAIAASVMAGKVLGNPGTVFITILIMLCTFGALNGMIITYARLYYKMAGDGLFFSGLSRVHPVFRTPHISLLVSMAMSCLLVFSGSFDQLTDLAIFAGFLFYLMLALAVFRLKRKGVITRKLPGFPYVHGLFVLFAVALLINTLITQPKETLFGILLISSGLPLYVYFIRKKRGL